MDSEKYSLIGRLAVLASVIDSRKSSDEHKRQARIELAQIAAQLNELCNGPSRAMRRPANAAATKRGPRNAQP